MDNMMAFPHNFSMYLEKGVACMQIDDFVGAADYFKKAIAIKPEVDLLLLCIRVMRELNQQEEAYQMLENYQPQLFDSAELTELDIELLELLIETDRIEESDNQMKKRRVLLANNPAFNQLNMMLEEKNSKQKIAKQQQLEQEIQAVEEKAHMILEDSYYAQIKWVQQLVKLPEPWFSQFAEEKLKEAFHPLLQTELISELQNRSSKQVFQIVKHDFKADVHLNDLPSLIQTPFFLKGCEAIDQASELSFSKKADMQQMFFLHCGYFYPFQEAAFGSVEAWLSFFFDKEETTIPVEVRRNIELAEAGLDLLT